jgi:hypothetical protein
MVLLLSSAPARNEMGTATLGSGLILTDEVRLRATELAWLVAGAVCSVLFSCVHLRSSRAISSPL